MPELSDRAESWPVHSTEDIWSGPAPFSVRRDRISAPGSPEDRFDRLVLVHPGACVVLAVDDAERALVLHQYRHPAQTRFVELPAGLLDAEGEDPLVAAQRELREEAELQAETWRHLVTMYPSPGLSSERIEIYLATDLSHWDRGDFELVREEADMTTAWVPISDLVTSVLAGTATDGPLGLAVMVYTLRAREPNTLSRSPR